MGERVLLLVPTTTYKVDDFLAAGRNLDVEVVVGSDRKQALEDEAPGTTLTLDFRRPAWSVARIAAFHARWPLRAVVGADDETTALAADAGQALGFPHNPVAAVEASRDKHRSRSCLAAAGLRTPWHAKLALSDGPAALAARAPYPCVLKPLGLSASRGVIRADDPAAFAVAFERIRAILGSDDLPPGADREHLLVEGYLPGREVAVEGLLERGALRVLAIFDKPDPLEGPTFEETLYVTPSRLPQAEQDAVAEETARGCRALGLSEGPVHIELRVHEGVPWLLEIAPRTIGGLCSRVLRFGTGISLEALVLRHALGRPTSGLERETAAAGVMMLPVPARGILREVHGLYDARRVEGVREITLTMTRGSEVVPLPEGHRYLGFVFATGPSASSVEAALREAHARLRFEID